jgi:hypothetical protein
MLTTKLRVALMNFKRISGTDHKSYIVILFELFYWILDNKGGINVYFDYELFLKNKMPGEYIKPKQFKKIEKELNTPSYFPILEDKYFFHQILEGQGFRIPKNYYLIENSSVLDLEKRKYLSETEFLNRDIDSFCKLINGYGGKSIFRIEVKNKKLLLNQKEMNPSEMFQILGKRKFIVQDRIIQHEEMNRLNPSCINTLRMLTIRTGNTYNMYSAYLRVGINNNFVDNSLSGNIMIGFDNNTGKLMKYAYTNDSKMYQEKLDVHPQTKVVFSDFTIPCYQEAVEMVKSLHGVFQQFFMIGWDIGITPEGPIVIEGNNITELYSFQVSYGGMKSSFFKLADDFRKYNL